MLEETTTAYHQKRLESAPLPSGTAPYTNSISFKLNLQEEKPNAEDWTHHLSDQGKSQCTSTLKEASTDATKAKLLSLGTARPASDLYPWEAMTLSTKNHISTQHDDPATASISCMKGENDFDLGIALNYGYAAGSPQMLRFVTEHIEMVHSPPYQDWESCLTCSTTSAIDLLFRILCNPGDCIIVEEYTYPGTIEAANRGGLNVLTIAMDEEGLLPEDLDRKLRQWNPACRKPSVLYTIPSGQNPTGATQPLERRRELYKIAEDHDLLIIEDDPYYFIQLEAFPVTVDGTVSSSMSDRFLRHLSPSYLSLDISGRVIRLDTTSKILAPGLRCGWMTACSQLVSKFLTATELSVVAPNGPSQVMLYKLLDDTWGHQGFVTWLVDLSSQYKQRLNTMVSACEEHLPANICTWSKPKSGMFLWIQVDWSGHPIVASGIRRNDSSSSMILQIEDSIHRACRQHGVQVSKGSWFAPIKPASGKMFFRVTFAAIAESDLTEAVSRFGKALHEDFRISEM